MMATAPRPGTMLLGTIILSLLAIGGPSVAAPADSKRLFGPDRYGTAAAIAAAAYPEGAATVFVATGRNFPDALAAVPAAYRAGAPLLLVTPGEVPSASAAALERLDPERMVVLGGEQAVGPGVTSQLAAVAPQAAIQRVAGRNRYATAARIARLQPLPESAVVYVASGEDFPDSLSAGPAAAARNGVILLTAVSVLPEETVDAIRRLAPSEIVVLGGVDAVSARVEAELSSLAPTVTRLSGSDRYATAAAISEHMDVDMPSEALIVRGDDFADGLAAGPYAAGVGAPVLLARHSCAPAPTLAAVDRLAPEAVTVVGGPMALHEHVADLIPCPQVLAHRFAVPWGVTFDTDGHAYVGERDTGRILRLDGTSAAFEVDPREVHQVDVDPSGSGGLLGLAAAQDTPGVLYAYITTPQDNRVVRIELGASVEPLLTGIPRGTGHFGGGLALGDDGLLYVATGDGRRPDAPRAAQDPEDLAGKILRVTPDGGIPDDNPIPGSPVYALGFRNPQGLAMTDQGWLLATDFGPDRNDEINRIVPSGNYGWPDVSGAVGHPQYVDPLVVRQPPEASWSGLAVLRGNGIPAWRGSVFAGALRGQRLWRFRFGPGEDVLEAEFLFETYGRIRSAAEAPDGALWFTTSDQYVDGDPRRPNDRIIRVGPPPR